LLEAAARPTARAGPAAGETLEARLAFGIDLAAVELLALVLVAENLVAEFSSEKRAAALGSFLLLSG